MYVLMIIAIYRLGGAIPLPGINTELLLTATRGTEGMLFAAIAGGEMGSIFAMGIAPYITASIIMQLLTVAVPALEQIKKEGQEGMKKINQITRVLAVVLAFIQGAGTVFSLRGIFIYQFLWVYIVAVLTVVSGTIFIMWLSELATERGIGNGASLIIFANILSSLPVTIQVIQSQVMQGGNFMAYLQLAILLIALLGIMGFVVLIQGGERRIPVQYSKKMVGRQMFGGESSFIPIKVNIAGVMSIIFAISLLQFPMMISQFWDEAARPEFLSTLMTVLDITHPIGLIFYVILIFCFTFFYTSFAINPTEMAENIKKNGGFIPGIRPGKPTGDYIQNSVDKLSWIGATFYALLATAPVFLEWGLGFSVGFGGTTLLIVVGVCLEFVKQLESRLLMRHYKGFLS